MGLRCDSGGPCIGVSIDPVSFPGKRIRWQRYSSGSWRKQCSVIERISFDVKLSDGREIFHIAGCVACIPAFLNTVVAELLQRNILSYSALLDRRHIDPVRRTRFHPLLEELSQFFLTAGNTGQTMAEMHSTREQTEAQVVHRQTGCALEQANKIVHLLLQ